MKLSIYPGMYVPHIGGLETHVDELVKHLKDEYQIVVIAPRIPKSAPLHEIRHEKVIIHRYPAFEIVQHFPIPNIFSKQFWKCIIKSDVYMTRTRFFPNSLLGFLVSKLYKKPNIHVEHGSAPVKSSNRFITFVGKMIDITYGKMIIKKSHTCISISKTVQAFLKNKFGVKTEIIQRGIEPNKNERDEKYEFIFVGRIVEWKGIFNLVEAFKNSKFKLDIFGYGPDEKKLVHKIKGLSNITFHGKITHKEASEIKACAKYYIHCSQPGGGLSSSLMEALWMGTPALATPHEGANEIITEKNGLLLKDGEIKTLKKGIETIINKNFNNETIKKDAQKKFSWEDSINKYKKVINSINL